MTNMPDFSTEKERQQWIINHADYFTVVLRRNMKNERIECPTLGEAEEIAAEWVKADPTARLLIYAVSGISDVYVRTVSK